jgi:hypothetical protein
MRASHLPAARRSSTAATHQLRPRTQPEMVLGRYRLAARLGTGAFGTVWAAQDERLGREVAVKILPRERIVGGRFEREARAAARLAHPAIVTLYEAAVDDDGAYLVSELVRGGTLADLLDAGRLSDRDIVAISIALCDALVHAHAQGVVHRDVKPSNVLIPQRPASALHPAKLTDFGVARVIGGDSLTRTGDVIGTAAYMAPEQAEGREAGPAADLYAVALVAYESLTGVNPVRVSSPIARTRRLATYLPPLRRQRRDLPRELGRGIDLALRPRPRERGSLEELRQSLVFSLEDMQDVPGVVSDSWRATRAGARRDEESDPGAEVFREPAAPAPGLAADSAEPEAEPAAAGMVPWPARGLAAVGTAITAGWLAAHLLAPSSVAPAAAAVLAGMAALVLPRLGWLAMILAMSTGAAAQGRAGGALVLVVASLIPVALLLRRGGSWSLPAGAPALGMIGLAGAWPALAARARTTWRRAALGFTGWVWLVLAAPLAGADLYTARASGTPAPRVWTESLPVAIDHVLGPVLSSGVLAGGLVWALAAAVLPWLIRSSSLAGAAVLVTVWSAVVVSATKAVIGLGHGGRAGSLPTTAVLGAVAGGVVALAPALVRAWRLRLDATSSGAQVP